MQFQDVAVLLGYKEVFELVEHKSLMRESDKIDVIHHVQLLVN